MMNATNICELAVQAVNSFQQHGYTERSIIEKKRTLCRIIEQHEQHGEHFFNADLIDQFIQESEKRFCNGDLARIQYRSLVKTATYLTELHNTGAMNFARRFVPKLTDYYEGLLTAILDYENWSEKGRKSVWSFAKTYFRWLLLEGHCDLIKVDETVVRKYLMDCSSRMMGSSLDAAKRALKKLYFFLYENGLSTGLYENLFAFNVPLEKKIKRPVPHTEIAAVLDIINRNTTEGKRDYAMILLAAITGLRAIDIIELKFNDIDWRNGEIRITQSKTIESLALPLTADVGTAIRDYIMNGRAESSLPHVFLRVNAPFSKISNSILHGQFNKYRALIGLHKCPFHDLRRALGSNMVISGVPVTTVAQVLGHTNIDSTKQYISLDSVHLKECALDFTGIEPDVISVFDVYKGGDTL